MKSQKLHRLTLSVFLFTILVPLQNIFAQEDVAIPDTVRFYDSAHHWYDIFDEDRVIDPLPGKPRYEKEEFRKIADNILLYQKNNGGWAKNFDMQAILTDEQKRALIDDKDNLNTTFDNGATHSQLTYLAEVYTLTGKERYKNAFYRGMEFVLEAQYDNGGWPQYFPHASGYHKYITFNDNAMIGVMNMLQDIVQNDPNYKFIDDELRERVNKSYHKGIDVILECQIIEDGVKTAWCQQHDEVTLEPQDARTFEKPSICNYESAEITEFLMNVNEPCEKVINAVESALKWFSNSKINGIKVEIIKAEEKKFLYHRSNVEKIVVEDKNAPTIWARFYELGTHKPIFVGRDGIVKYSLKDIGRDRRTGYGWYTYEPEIVLEIYPLWKEKYVKDK